MSACRIGELPPDFHRWDELLGLITEAFAYMDELIDPPSSAKRLMAESLREKATAEKCFVTTYGVGLVGCIFADARTDHVYIGKFAVANAWRGRGVGRPCLMRWKPGAAAKDTLLFSSKPGSS